MTIFSDEVLMLHAAEMEEWYERELVMRAETELRVKMVGGFVPRPPPPPPPPPPLQTYVGLVPAFYNMINNNGPNLAGPMDFSTNGKQINPASDNRWTPYQSSVIAGAGIGPDGTLTASKLIENTVNDFHLDNAAQDFNGLNLGQTSGLDSGLGSISNMALRCALIAKALERTRVVFGFFSTQGGVNSHLNAGFDLAGGQIFDTFTDTKWASLGQTITPLGGGWFLCIVDGNLTDALTGRGTIQISMDSGSGLAARNISYTGTGNSGILIWWASLLPKVAWSLSNQTFFDDFLSSSTIDLTDSRAAGFNWYTHNRWPKSAGVGFQNANPTPSNMLVVSNSILQITNEPNPGVISGQALTSATPDPASDGSRAIGNFFTFPALFESSLAFDNTIFQESIGGQYIGSVPSFWSYTIEASTGVASANLGATVSHAAELDFMEALPGGASGGKTFVKGSILDTNLNTPPGNGLSVSLTGGIAAASISDFHKFSAIVIPATPESNLAGCYLHFYDGNWMGASYQGWNLAGPYSVTNTQHQLIILGAGQGVVNAITTPWPHFIDYVKVIQLPFFGIVGGFITDRGGNNITENDGVTLILGRNG